MVLAGVLSAAVLSAAACSDALSPIPWSDAPNEATLFSASRDVYAGEPSGFDLGASPVRTVKIESETAVGGWDIALVDNGGGLAIESAQAFQGVTSTARISQITNTAFADVKTAFKDSVKYTVGPVPLVMGSVYLVKSRTIACALTSGPIYAKLEPLEINVAAGTFRFNYVSNPNCGDRSLVAPDN